MDTGAAAHSVDPRLLLTTLGEACYAVPGEIAARIGVREEHVADALGALERAGLVVHRGDGTWALPPRSAGELRELYVVAVLLEGLALRSCPPFSAAQIAELRSANARLRDSGGDVAEALAADEAFHAVLVASCANPALLRTHASTKAALARYDHAYWDAPGHLERSTAQHDAIVAALEAGDHAAAAAIVRANFEGALPSITERLEAEGTP